MGYFLHMSLMTKMAIAGCGVRFVDVQSIFYVTTDKVEARETPAADMSPVRVPFPAIHMCSNPNTRVG